MKFTFIINDFKLTVTADSISDARIKVCEICEILEIDDGELNKLEPEIFES